MSISWNLIMRKVRTFACGWKLYRVIAIACKERLHRDRTKKRKENQKKTYSRNEFFSPTQLFSSASVITPLSFWFVISFLLSFNSPDHIDEDCSCSVKLHVILITNTCSCTCLMDWVVGLSKPYKLF